MELQLIAYWYKCDDILNVGYYEKMFLTAVMLWKNEEQAKLFSF